MERLNDSRVTVLPKAHLHTHLESTVRPETVLELGGHPLTRDHPYGDFREFADDRARIRALLRTPEHFRRVALEFCADEAAQGVRYCEVTFTAASHGERVGDGEMPLEAVIDGLAEGRRAYGIDCRLLLDHSRRRPVERFRKTLRLAQNYDEVAGLGLSGDERYPLAPFKDVIDEAAESGVHLVHHAGEHAGAESVREAVTIGRAERIAHGIRVLDDPALVTKVIEHEIALDVCPTSNVLLGVVDSFDQHPLPRLLDAGLSVTLNTDGETSLADEYRRVAASFGIDDAGLAALARAGVDASFAGSPVKQRLRKEIDDWLADRG